MMLLAHPCNFSVHGTAINVIVILFTKDRDILSLIFFEYL